MIKKILEELVQDPELKKYPHSYNPIIIEKALAQIKKELVECVKSVNAITPDGKFIKTETLERIEEKFR